MKTKIELLQIIISFLIFILSIYFLIRSGYYLDEFAYVDEISEVLIDGYGPFFWFCFLFSGIQFILSIINHFIKYKK